MSSRPLTPGEVELARSIFGDAIDYGRVRLIRRRWWPFQPKGIVMAPTGNIHFHPASEKWSEDFSCEPLAAQGLFIHEMTHVWQSQTRGRLYLPLMRHPFADTPMSSSRTNRSNVTGLNNKQRSSGTPS